MLSKYKNLIALGAAATLSFGVAAQTTWNMATPYPESEFHTKTFKPLWPMSLKLAVRVVNQSSLGTVTVQAP